MSQKYNAAVKSKNKNHKKPSYVNPGYINSNINCVKESFPFKCTQYHRGFMKSPVSSFGRQVHVLETGNNKREIRLDSHAKNGNQKKPELVQFGNEKANGDYNNFKIQFKEEKVLSYPQCSLNVKQEIADVIYPSECADQICGKS